MKYQIVITYRNGSIITLDVPNNYYQEKYSKKSDTAIHKIFIKEYKNFINAMNKNDSMVDVGKYLEFSNATISASNILGIDLKTIDEVVSLNESNISIPGVHDKTYLDISETSLDTILKKLESTNLIENLDKFIQKVNSMMSKNNVEVVIKAGGAKKKSSSTPSSKKINTNNNIDNNNDDKDIVINDQENKTINPIESN